MAVKCALVLLLVCLFFQPGFSQDGEPEMSKAQLVSEELRAVTAGLAKEIGVAQKRYEAYISKTDQTEAVLATGFGRSRFESAARVLETRLAFYRRRVSQLRQSINLLSEQKTKTEEAYLEQANFNDQTLEDAKSIMDKAPGSVQDMLKLLESTVGAYKKSISVAQEDTMKSFSTTRTLLHHHMGLFMGARDKLKEISTLMGKAADALDINDGKYNAQANKTPVVKQQLARDQLTIFNQVVKDIESNVEADLSAPSNPDEGWGAITADEDELSNMPPMIEGLAMAEDDGPPEALGALKQSMDSDSAEHTKASEEESLPETPPVLERPSIAESVYKNVGGTTPPPLPANCKVCNEIPTCENCKTCSITDRTCDECPKATCMDKQDGSQPAVPVPKLPVKPEIPVVPGAAEVAASLQCVRCPADKPSCATNCEKCKITEQDCRTCPMAICEKACAACPKEAPKCDDNCLECTTTKRTCESCPIAMCRKLKFLLTFPSSDNFEGGTGEVTRRGSASAWEEVSSDEALFQDYPTDMVGFRFKPSAVGAIYMVAFLTDPTAEKPASAVPVAPPTPPSPTVPTNPTVTTPEPAPAPVDGTTPIPQVPAPAPGTAEPTQAAPEAVDESIPPPPPEPVDDVAPPPVPTPEAPAEAPAVAPAQTGAPEASLMQLSTPPGYGAPSRPVWSSFLELAGGARSKRLARRMSRGRALGPATATAAGGVAAGKTGLTVLGNDIVVYCNGQVAKLDPNMIEKATSFSAVVTSTQQVEFSRNGAPFYSCETKVNFPLRVIVASPAAGAHPSELQFIRLADRVIQ